MKMKQPSQAELLALIEGSRQGDRAAQDALMQSVQKRVLLPLQENAEK